MNGFRDERDWLLEKEEDQNVIGRGYNGNVSGENTIWGERNKVQIAIERLQQFEPPGGYYVAISGWEG